MTENTDYMQIRKNIEDLEEKIYSEFEKVDYKDDGIPRMMSIARTNFETAILYVDKACFIAWKAQMPLCEDDN